MRNNADSEFEVEKLCLSTHLRENRVLKNLRRRQDVPNLENSDKFKMNHLFIHIIRREI